MMWSEAWGFWGCERWGTTGRGSFDMKRCKRVIQSTVDVEWVGFRGDDLIQSLCALEKYG